MAEISTDKARGGKGKHPNSLANLRPFQKGNHANPNGRPRKDCSITSLLKEELDKICPADKQKRTWRQLIVQAWLQGCIKSGRGQSMLLGQLLDRVDGKVVQPIGGAEDGRPIKVEITVSSENAKKLTEEIIRGEGT